MVAAVLLPSVEAGTLPARMMPGVTPVPRLGRVWRVELVPVGTHRGLAYTAADLREITANFHRFSVGPDALLRVPLKIGHEEHQPLVSGMDPETATGMSHLDNTGTPKFGRVADVWFDGSYLCGRFEEVPEWLVYLMNQRAYDSVSVEVYRTPPEGIPATGRMLRAVSLLGGEIPHIKNLSQIPLAEFYSYSERRVCRYRPIARLRSRSVLVPDGGSWVTYSEVVRMDRDEIIAELEKMGANREVLERADENTLGEWLRMMQEAKEGAGSGAGGDAGAMGGMGGETPPGDAPPADVIGSEDGGGIPPEEQESSMSDGGDGAMGGTDEGQGSLFGNDGAMEETETPGAVGGAMSPPGDGAGDGDGDEETEESLAKKPKAEGMAKLRERIQRYTDSIQRCNDMGKKCYGESWAGGATPSKGTKPVAKPPMMAKGSSEGIQSFSETAIKKLVADVVKQTAQSLLSPVRGQVQKLSEETKKARIDEVLSMYSDRIHPWELDGSSGLPTLRDDLLSRDAVVTVHKLSEGKASRELTAFDVEVEKIKRRPVVSHLRRERIQSGKAGVMVYSEGTKTRAEHAVDMFCEQHSRELDTLNMTKTELMAAYNADPNIREFVHEKVG